MVLMGQNCPRRTTASLVGTPKDQQVSLLRCCGPWLAVARAGAGRPQLRAASKIVSRDILSACARVCMCQISKRLKTSLK